MVTGLVATTGSLRSIEVRDGATRLLVEAPELAGQWRQGDSIAVNGVCLTALPVEDAGAFAADLAHETVERTTLGKLAPSATVNLELPTPAGSPLGGHVVQGHVDGVATLLSLVPLGPDLVTADWRLTLRLSSELATGVVQQGSLTVDGISLTVAKLHAPDLDGTVRAEIAIIPHTYRSTHLHSLAPGALLNIETDVLAKYAGKQRGQDRREWLTGEYLMANGY